MSNFRSSSCTRTVVGARDGGSSGPTQADSRLGTRAMGRPMRVKGPKGKQTSLTDGGFDFAKYPQLKKPLQAKGEAIQVPGRILGQVPDCG